MKVKDLIAKLAYCDPDATVVTSEDVGGNYWYWEIQSVDEEKRPARDKKTWNTRVKGKSKKTVLIG